MIISNNRPITGALLFGSNAQRSRHRLAQALPATNTARLRARRHDPRHYPIKLISLNAHRLLNIIIV